MNRTKRVEIIKGIAHALSYLHYNCSRPIVHRDTSSNNVLLNSSFKTFVPNFGTVQAVEMNRMKRVEIVKGIAHDLSYLHYDCSRPIVQRDISSNNVLLNSSFKAFVTNFGIAKMLNLGSSNQTITVGTCGYIALGDFLCFI
ncbi:hypothetical protein J1N35_045073 [Gossypium stocksii]|uniref:non-specific serine/threonine protein kinase n=1 Tax=Gossypium stocksii TaxID=47602 RepID=A0A9D3ZG75_9ROSI|nr:hypothetical protein J1N35_045073 [Gossypium stocksii]